MVLRERVGLAHVKRVVDALPGKMSRSGMLKPDPLPRVPRYQG